MNKRLRLKRGTGLLPSDIMLLFARHLRPKDLFSMSFTSKLNYHMIASVLHIWKRARLMFMPARILPPPNSMTEKEYAWFLTSDRCTNCHLVKPLTIDWGHLNKSCVECHSSQSSLAKVYLQGPDVVCRRIKESDKEVGLDSAEYGVRVRSLGVNRGRWIGEWDKAILAKIPLFAAALACNPMFFIDNAFEQLKNYISQGMFYS
jgi:hypothetical protein